MVNIFIVLSLTFSYFPLFKRDMGILAEQAAELPEKQQVQESDTTMFQIEKQRPVSKPFFD